jgi:hypothetical protein
VAEKLTLNYLATALVDIPDDSMPIVCSLKPETCDKTAHFRVAVYCPQYKMHLCNNHGVKSAS